MKNVTGRLTRFYTPKAVMGEMVITLEDGEIETFKTVEKPWRDNEVSNSCTPEGIYTVKRHHSPTHGECFKIQDVHGRTHILIHVANQESEVEGCLGIGTEFGTSYNVTRSRDAMRRLLSRVVVTEFTLTVTAYRAEQP